MSSSQIGCELAVLAVLCVLSIFLFPAGSGPYSVIHGPVTALQAVRVAARLRLAILAAALAILFTRAKPLAVCGLPDPGCLGSPESHQFDLTTILRC